MFWSYGNTRFEGIILKLWTCHSKNQNLSWEIYLDIDLLFVVVVFWVGGEGGGYLLCHGYVYSA